MSVLGFQGLGFGFQGLGFRFQGLRVRVSGFAGLGFGVGLRSVSLCPFTASGCRNQGLGP